MDKNKANRIKSATVVAAFVLLIVLAIILIWQICQIGSIANKKVKLQNDIKYYEQQIDEMEDNLDYYTSEYYLQKKAYEYGYINR